MVDDVYFIIILQAQLKHRYLTFPLPHDLQNSRTAEGHG